MHSVCWPYQNIATYKVTWGNSGQTLAFGRGKGTVLQLTILFQRLRHDFKAWGILV